MLKLERFPIDKIYVPVKRRKSLNAEVVREIAESILEIGQQTPILVRPDDDRFVLVEGFHRLEACKALGEKTINGFLVSSGVVHQDSRLPDFAQAERQKMERLRKLRLQKEAAERLAIATRPVMGTKAAALSQNRRSKHIRDNLKETPGRVDRRTSESTPTTLSDWLNQQERDGGRY